MQHAGVGAAADDGGIGGAAAVAAELGQQLRLHFILPAPGAGGGHGQAVGPGADACGPGHDVELGAVLHQPHLVEQVLQGHELAWRPGTAAHLLPHLVHPAEKLLVELRVAADAEVHPAAPLQQPGQDVVDVVDGERVVGAVLGDRALLADDLTVPELALGVALLAEQNELAVFTAGHQHRHGVRLREAGEVQQVAVLAVGMEDIPVAPPLRCGGDDGDALIAHQPHQFLATFRVLAGSHAVSRSVAGVSEAWRAGAWASPGHGSPAATGCPPGRTQAVR